MGEAYHGSKRLWFKFQKWFVWEEPNADGEVKGFCPFHEDSHPSAHWNVEMQLVHCKVCGEGWNFQVIERALNEGELHEPTDEDRESAKDEAKTRLADLKPETPLTEELIEGWHENLLANTHRILWLMNHRGVDHETIVERKIGWQPLENSANGGRYTLPILDEDGALVNVRRYDPKEKYRKMLSLTGYGSPVRLFPIENLVNSQRILLVEGEWDALIASQFGVPAVSGTGGAGTFSAKWLPYFAGKDVVIMYDNDEAGHTGARVAASKLAGVAASVRVGTVPGPEGSDVADLFGVEGYSRQGLLDLMDEAAEHSSRSVESAKIEEASVPIMGVPESYNPGLVNKSFEMRAQVIGREGNPWLVPARIEYECAMDKGKECITCPMKLHFNGSGFIEIDKDNLFHMDVMNRDKRTPERTLMLEARGIPKRCDRVTVDVTEHYAGETLVAQDVPHGQGRKGGTPNERTIYNLGSHGTRPGSTIVFKGTSFSSKDNENLMFTWDSQPEGLDMDKFSIDDHTADLLRRFQPTSEQSPLDKLYEIAADVSANVTRIYGRPDLHVAFDLVMHSVLFFKFRGDLLRGRLDAACLGDTRTGKSRATTKMIEHYGAGAILNCETASVAGLIGGVVRTKGGDLLKWGAFPMHHRRLLALDEASGLVGSDPGRDRNLFSELTGIRDSGLAQISKIAAGETDAALRLWWLTNTSSGRRMSRFGVLEFQDLIGKPEDIARFDFVLGLSSSEVAQDIINSQPTLAQMYTKQACHSLVMWAWSRTPDQVIFTKEAEQAAIRASLMSERYTEDIPLIQRANVSEKIARIALAIAARTFSTDETLENVVVTEEHVDDAVLFLDTIYSKECFGYRQYSETVLRTELVAEDKVDWLLGVLNGKRALTKYLLQSQRIEARSSVMRAATIHMGSEGSSLLEKMYEYGFLEQVPNSYQETYVATPALINALQRRDR